MASDEIRKIHEAWNEEGSMSRLGLRPFASKDIQDALVPAGGDWQCVAQDGAITRTIVWRHSEVALVNPRGDLGDYTEGQIAMGIRATPVMDKALRTIFILAGSAENLDLIAKIARAAIDYVEKPPPRIPDPEEPEDEEATARVTGKGCCQEMATVSERRPRHSHPHPSQGEEEMSDISTIKAELRELEKKATAGKWMAHPATADMPAEISAPNPNGLHEPMLDLLSTEDAAFIAATRNHILALLDSHDELIEGVNAALNMVAGDGAPPNWNWLHEIIARATLESPAQKQGE